MGEIQEQRTLGHASSCCEVEVIVSERYLELSSPVLPIDHGPLCSHCEQMDIVIAADAYRLLSPFHKHSLDP